MPIRNVLFDLGDTLWHFPELPPTDVIRGETMRRISGLLAEWGVPFEGPMRFLGREIRLGVERADRAAYESDCVSPDFNAVVREIAAASGLEIDYAQACRLWDAWNLGGLTLGRTMFDDAFSTLDWLRERGWRLGCVTNRVFGGSRFDEELRELGLDAYFEATAVSCDVGYMKPHPRIFEHVFDAMRIEPRETAMVGDSLKADVQAAQALGMTAIWRRVRRPDRRHEPEEVGEGPSGGLRPATRAETGRALGEFGGGEGVTPDFEIWQLAELKGLPIFG
ncbi:MAG: HAD family hydrolase [Dehalococcoidia bacterium]|nr:HAD family hydrolase [Dehalococcoidia bacterium]